MTKLNPSMYSLDSPRNLIFPPKIPFDRLLDLELGSRFKGRQIDINDILEAVTLRGAGEIFDMEKLETLGDSFLKYSMSLALFCNETVKKGDEGFLTQYRSNLVGNKRLFILAKRLNLEQLISGVKFEPHLNWCPPRFSNDSSLEKQLIEWDQEFRLSLKDNYGDNDDVLEPKKDKLSLSKVTLFQMMQEKDWMRIKSPEFEGTSIAILVLINQLVF